MTWNDEDIVETEDEKYERLESNDAKWKRNVFWFALAFIAVAILYSCLGR